MKACFIFFVFLLSFSQSLTSQTIIGRLIVPKSDTITTWTVSIQDGTGDTTYSSSSLLSDSVFRFTVAQKGDLCVLLTKPNRYPVNISFLPETTSLIQFDVVISSNNIRLVFADTASSTSRFASINLDSYRRKNRYFSEFDAFRKSGKDIKDFAIDWKDEDVRLLSSLYHQTVPLLREELIIQYIELGGYGCKSFSMDTVRRYIAEVRAESPAWIFHSNLSYISPIWHPDTSAYLSRILATSPSRYMRAMILYNKLSTAFYIKDTIEAQSDYAQLISNYADTKWARKGLEKFTVAKTSLAIGDKVPIFNFTNIPANQGIISNKNLLRKTYLIAFWATWCVPCLAEMPFLHSAFERFKNRNFMILSVSLDKSIADVTRYRHGKWGMPWLNAFAEGGMTNKFVQSFGVWYVPTLLLVDGKGKVIALDKQLKGDQLDAMLDKLLPKKYQPPNQALKLTE
jgi:thiol-disulfide isomerase/thioredoxin